MTLDEYRELALRTEASWEVIHDRIVSNGKKAIRVDMASRGLANDVGEVNDLVKDWLEYGKPLDTVHMLEEAGDVLWRLNQLLDAVGLTLEQAMKANIAKLSVRYPDKYTDDLAANRDREEERRMMEAVCTEAFCASCGKTKPIDGRCATCGNELGEYQKCT